MVKLIIDVSNSSQLIPNRILSLLNRKLYIFPILVSMLNCVPKGRCLTDVISATVPDVFTGCVIILPPSMWMIYIIPLIYDLTMFIMTVSRIWVLSKDFGVTPLMQRLAEKSVLISWHIACP
jgi:hypothetical protein